MNAECRISKKMQKKQHSYPKSIQHSETTIKKYECRMQNLKKNAEETPFSPEINSAFRIMHSALCQYLDSKTRSAAMKNSRSKSNQSK